MLIALFAAIALALCTGCGNDSIESTDTAPPQVAMVAPNDGATVSGVVIVAATAHDDVAVAELEFLLSGAYLATANDSRPYRVEWDTRTVSDGSYTLKAVVRDTSDNSSESEESIVNVANGSALPLPTISFVAHPEVISEGGSSTLIWTSTNVTSCTGTGFATNGASSGEVVVSPATSALYELSCTGPGGTTDDDVTVTVTDTSSLPIFVSHMAVPFSNDGWSINDYTETSAQDVTIERVFDDDFGG
jgi:hypothetical protein